MITRRGHHTLCMLVVGVVFDLTRFELTWIRLGQRFSFKWRVGKLVLARIRSLELLPNRRADYYTAKFLNDNAIHENLTHMVKVLKVLPHFRKGRDFTLNRRIIFKTGVLNLVSTKNLQVRATDVEIQRTPSFFWHARWYARQRRLRIKTRGIQVPKNHWMGAIIYTAVTGSQLFFSLEFDRSELEKQIGRASSTCTPTRSIALFGCSMPLESPRLVAT